MTNKVYLINEQEVLERTNPPILLTLFNIKYQLYCLTTVNYAAWFPCLHHIPWLLWLNNGTIMGPVLHNHGFNCHSRTVWLPWLSNSTLDSSMQIGASFASTSEV
jgi:hypothetical protein